MSRDSKEVDLSLAIDEDQRYFLNPESVSEHLYCSICQEVFGEPQRAPCGHSYCKLCINQWLKTSRTCPDDRKPLKPSDLHHDFILENIIGDQMVACPFRKLGCAYVGQLATSSSHKKECNFNPTNMPDFLRKDALKNSFSKSNGSVSADSGDELPEPVKPSLKMRLFSAGGGQRDMLCNMFDKKTEQKQETGSSDESAQSCSRNKSKKRKLNH